MNGHAMIIGAGIGGLATAIALRRAGIEVTVYEGYDRATGNENSLSIAANGLRALDSLDCLDPVREAGFPLSRMSIWNGRGKRLGTLPFAGSDHNHPEGIATSRGPLITALADRARELGASITHGHRFVHAETRTNDVVAQFHNATTATGTVLIGADGEYSRVRSVIDPHAPNPRYAGLVECGGHTQAEFDLPPNEITMMFGRRAFFGCARTPKGGTSWFANIPTTPEPTTDELRSLPSTEWKQRLMDLFADDTGPARTIIEATEHPLRPRASHILPPVPIWHRHRMLIIGDAAHCASPSSGQGASMAIEDAVVLAGHLRASDCVDTAFTGYENTRRHRVERVARYGARSSRSKTHGPIARTITDALMPHILQRITTHRTLDWLYNYNAAAQIPTPA